MTTLISAGNSEGEFGRCDAKCYNATHPDCDCICGGANHGVGFKLAIENTERYVDDWIEVYAKKHNLEKKDFHLGKDVFQMALFDMPEERKPFIVRRISRTTNFLEMLLRLFHKIFTFFSQ